MTLQPYFMKICATLLLCTLLFSAANAQPVVSYQPFITGLSAPVEIANAGDGSSRLFIAQQDGIIKVYDPAAGGLQATPFLDISTLVRFQGEQGLLSLAFHPDYENNGYFFVYYNNTAGEITVARYNKSANANIADAGSGEVLLTIPKPFANHNGGHLQFGKDGYLYFATGDGGSANDPQNNAQNGLSLLGKMLRINADNFSASPYYTVPANNPFVGNSAFDSRIWALGLRNPFRWSFDRQTGDMWIGDVGQGSKEEVNYTPASSTGGENYGWRCYEGSISTPNVPDCNPPNYVPPIFEYDNPPNASSSVIGGYVYRGNEYPFFNGYYIAADVYSGTVYLIRPNGSGGWTTTQQTGLQNFVVAFGEAENGTLYAASQGTGTVYKVVAAQGGALPVGLQRFEGSKAPNGNELRWTTATEEAGAKFIVEFGRDAVHFEKAGEVAARGNAGGGSYNFFHRVVSGAPLFYRLQLVEATGSARYSGVVNIEGRESRLQVYPSVVRDGRFYVNSRDAVERVQVLNSNGAMVLDKRFASANSPQVVELPSLPKGIYMVQVYARERSSHRIMIE
jgi:glucose/arabinose dehydrogenase